MSVLRATKGDARGYLDTQNTRKPGRYLP